MFPMFPSNIDCITSMSFSLFFSSKILITCGSVKTPRYFHISLSGFRFSTSFLYLQNLLYGSREKSQHLGRLIALSEDPGWFLASMWGLTAVCHYRPRKSNTFFWHLRSSGKHIACTNMQTKHQYLLNN